MEVYHTPKKKQLMVTEPKNHRGENQFKTKKTKKEFQHFPPRPKKINLTQRMKYSPC